MAFTVDPNQEPGSAGASNIPKLTPGTRTMWVCGVDFGQARSGNKKIDVRLVCVDDDKEGAEVGAYCWDTFTLTQAAAWKLGQVARALGQTDQFDAEDETLMDEILRRSPLIVDLEEHEYNGNKKVKVSRYSAHTGEIPEAWEDTVQRGEEWHEGGKKKSSGGGFGTSDDIPF